MKIIGFKEFTALPEGTIYSYYEPHHCYGLFRKGQTIMGDGGKPIDYFEADLVPSAMNLDPMAVDGMEGRWGLYEYDQLYCVFEAADVAALKSLLPA